MKMSNLKIARIIHVLCLYLDMIYLWAGTQTSLIRRKVEATAIGVIHSLISFERTVSELKASSEGRCTSERDIHATVVWLPEARFNRELKTKYSTCYLPLYFYTSVKTPTNGFAPPTNRWQVFEQSRNRQEKIQWYSELHRFFAIKSK